MDMIINIIGKSGTGKTSICKLIEETGANVVKSYTTRSPRTHSEYGHIFVDTQYYDVVKSIDDVCVKNKGDHFIIAELVNYEKNEVYFATIEQVKNKGISLYVVDPEGAKMVKDRVHHCKVVNVLLTCDEEERVKRMFNRGDSEISVTTRVQKDREVFKNIQCDYAIDVTHLTLQQSRNELMTIIRDEILEQLQNIK